MFGLYLLEVADAHMWVALSCTLWGWLHAVEQPPLKYFL